MLLRARHFETGQLVDVTIADGRIAAIGPAMSAAPDREAGWIAPAFFDLQINGCDQISFNSPNLTVENIRHVAAACRSHGIAQFFPTLVTNSFEAIAHGFATLAKACDSDPKLARALPGFHLEGPYISAEDGPRRPSQGARSPAGLGRVSSLAGSRRRTHQAGDAVA